MLAMSDQFMQKKQSQYQVEAVPAKQNTQRIEDLQCKDIQRGFINLSNQK